MKSLTCHNPSDEVLLALTHGPTPGVQGWTIKESAARGDVAQAVLSINGIDYLVTVSPLGESE